MGVFLRLFLGRSAARHHEMPRIAPVRLERWTGDELVVPTRKISRRAERRGGGEYLRMAPRHQEGHVSAAGRTHDVDAVQIDLRMGLCVFYGIDDILHGRIAATRLRRPVWAAEAGTDHRPAVALRMLVGAEVVMVLADVAAPGMEADKQRHRIRICRFRRIEVTRLHRAVIR